MAVSVETGGRASDFTGESLERSFKGGWRVVFSLYEEMVSLVSGYLPSGEEQAGSHMADIL